MLKPSARGQFRGEWIDPDLGRVTLRAWSTEWLETIRPALKPKAFASYESLMGSRVLVPLGGYQLAGLKPSDVQAWINRMQSDGLSASRIR